MWQDITISQPADGQDVWIRRTWWYSHPVTAVWAAAAQTFTIDGSGLVAPWWAIARWKPV